MAEISQAMIASLQETAAQLAAAVSSLNAAVANVLVNKADKTEVDNLSARVDSVQTDITAISAAVKPVVDVKVG